MNIKNLLAFIEPRFSNHLWGVGKKNYKSISGQDSISYYPQY